MKTLRFLLPVIAVACVAARLSAAPEVAKEITGSSPGIAKVAYVPSMEKAPSIVKKVAPVYPRELRAKGIQGFATIDVLVDSTGRVVGAEVATATDREFAARALTAAKQWTFSPAIAQGRPVTTRVRLPFEFVMPQVAALDAR